MQESAVRHSNFTPENFFCDFAKGDTLTADHSVVTKQYGASGKFMTKLKEQ